MTGIKGESPLICRAQSGHANTGEALHEIADQLGATPLALVILFISRCHDREQLAKDLPGLFGEARVIGCTTAGEIGAEGYLEDHIVAIGLPRSDFRARVGLLGDLARFSPDHAMDLTLEMRSELIQRVPEWPNEVAFLLSDGLSLKEDQLVWALSTALGQTPLVGGSAGDGLHFRQTFVLADGVFHTNAAVLAILRTRCKVVAFRFDHLLPSDKRMVVTGADPANRLVTEINGQPAAREYARILGKDPDQLSPFLFAANPVVVRVGGHHHVRAIQKVEDNGDLRFFSAIDEGLVLRLAEGQDITTHLEASLEGLGQHGPPLGIIACDCILRRLEIESTQATRKVSALLARHGVTGFNTYGEQFNMLHVNQTFTGLAFYPPDKAPMPWPSS